VIALEVGHDGCTLLERRIRDGRELPGDAGEIDPEPLGLGERFR
jgi:hypothetical protein